MASTNQSPQYQAVERKFLVAQRDEDKLKYLEEMIRECPKHKSSEKMLANLKTRYVKLKNKLEKQNKVRKSKSAKTGIKKAEMQAALIGLTNSGKSCLINKLTNTQSLEAPYEFTTKQVIVGTMLYQGVHIQIIDLPAINHETFDQGLANSADTLLIIITKISDIEKIESFLPKAKGKRIIVFNKIDRISQEELRKTEATLKSKKLNYIMISCTKEQNINELREKLWQSFNKIRIYTKEPGKPKTPEPVILNQDSTVKDAAEKILHGFSSKIKETILTGPSSKFPNQKVGLKHILKDKDIIEFHVK